MPGSILGSTVRRREDPRLITGRGRYVDDLASENDLYAAFVRSPVAHARIGHLELSRGLATSGVVGVFAAADLNLPPRLSFAVLPEVFARPPLAVDAVRFVGDAVAVVVAETQAAAADGADAVAAEYEPLPVVAMVEQAAAENAPAVFPEHGSNIAFAAAYGGDEDALMGADVIVRGRFVNQRLAAVPMEPDVFRAAPDADSDVLRIWASTQSPFQVRDFVADCLGLTEDKVICVAPDVGGGFGAKLAVYPEQVVVAALAQRLARPVRWVQSRSECFLAMTQGRGQVQKLELGALRSGELVGLRVRVKADAGAYPGLGAFLPYFTGQMLSGAYRIPRIDYAYQAYVTNTTPMNAYRGAGRPEATALLERGMDLLASELGIDPAELRRRNLIPPDEFPLTTTAGADYDSGEYERSLNRALELAGYHELRAEQRRRREAGDRKALGIGVSTYVEITAVGSATEFGSVEATADGSFQVLAGTANHGQGHETAYAQVVADTLQVPIESVRVVEADTGMIPRGDGTSASRSLQIAGSSVLEAARALLERARNLAAEVLEASPDDVVPLGDGRLGVRGVPGSGLTWAALAVAAAERGETLHEEHDVMVEPSFPFGTHIAVAEVDLETGDARLIRHVAVDDCGRQINPMLVQGQVHGGIGQGAAQALFEEVVYDRDGNPLTASLVDYGMPTANELPSIETDYTVTPSPNNPLGAKGIGEAGTIGATPAVQNAVIDALSHLGVRHIDMPLTPEKVWQAIRQADGPKA
ncbi:MAG TPA: xanthine dehydrogenase family protein molybdopterin-binding subunit [Candidatus Dormibacteraeota bacterium]|nr:xanthine dehydrogenase family protein molybdopterin-binding subunit [Candidatus Dormibacteraeota bacterium]